MGTAVKGYVTCTTRQEPDYDPAMDLADEDRAEHMRPSAMDLQRSKNKSWEYLLDGRRPGEFSVGVHGKILAIAAGHVSPWILLYDSPLMFTLLASGFCELRSGGKRFARFQSRLRCVCCAISGYSWHKQVEAEGQQDA